MFISKQLFDVDLHGLKIRNDKGNMIMDDVSMFKVLSMHEEEREEKIHLYVKEDTKATPLALRMPKCYYN